MRIYFIAVSTESIHLCGHPATKLPRGIDGCAEQCYPGYASWRNGTCRDNVHFLKNLTDKCTRAFQLHQHDGMTQQLLFLSCLIHIGTLKISVQGTSHPSLLHVTAKVWSEVLAEGFHRGHASRCTMLSSLNNLTS